MMPMNEPTVHSTQADPTDLEHLELLGIFHYIIGGMTVLFSSVFIIHVAMGLMMALDPDFFETKGQRGPDFPPLLGYAMAAFAACLVMAGWTIGILTIYSGRCLRHHRRRLLSLVVGGIQCLSFPFGTVLGVFTIVVLQRPSVRRLYGE